MAGRPLWPGCTAFASARRASDSLFAARREPEEIQTSSIAIMIRHAREPSQTIVRTGLMPNR